MTISDESMPPDRNAPSGTSATIRSLTQASKTRSKESMAASSEANPVRVSIACLAASPADQ